MSLVPPGYKLLLQKPDGEVFYSLELEEYDLTKGIARASVIDEVSEALEAEIAKL